MNRLVDVNFVVAHTRIDVDLESEKALLETYIDAAQEVVLDLLDRDIEDLINTYHEIPKRVKVAIATLAAYQYEVRTPASRERLSEVPWSVNVTLMPLMKI